MEVGRLVHYGWYHPPGCDPGQHKWRRAENRYPLVSAFWLQMWCDPQPWVPVAVMSLPWTTVSLWTCSPNRLHLPGYQSKEKITNIKVIKTIHSQQIFIYNTHTHTRYIYIYTLYIYILQLEDFRRHKYHSQPQI